jgi:hypothetical protein
MSRANMPAYLEDDLRQRCTWREFRVEAGNVLFGRRALDDWAKARMMPKASALWCLEYLFGDDAKRLFVKPDTSISEKHWEGFPYVSEARKEG